MKSCGATIREYDQRVKQMEAESAKYKKSCDITIKEYDQKVKQLEAEIAKYKKSWFFLITLVVFIISPGKNQSPKQKFSWPAGASVVDFIFVWWYLKY